MKPTPSPPSGKGPSERRQAPRFNISMPVTFTVAQSGRMCAGMVDNISLGGVLLLTDEQLAHGDRIIIHIPITVDMTVTLEAVIVRTSSLGEVGVAFMSLDDEAMQRLAELVDSRAQRDT
ncbi:MAG: PilZ domain-containing protein [Candidatus Eremiobacteraeota bacterium]|nr:PilZ domain-containing protein [Candidatus Eremiobacteraeota bacterium]MBV8460671.1 PilZ domain-containing protein [Candidatus Eremiobacteraeota bacterium]